MSDWTYPKIEHFREQLNRLDTETFQDVTFDTTTTQLKEWLNPTKCPECFSEDILVRQCGDGYSCGICEQDGYQLLCFNCNRITAEEACSEVEEPEED